MHLRRLSLVLIFVALAQLPGTSGRSGPATPQVLWTFDTGGCLAHAPAVVGDMVYVASGNGVLGQLERATGKLRWVTIMGRNASACMFRGPLMLAGNLVLSGSSSMTHHTGQVRAVDLTTGRQQWSQSAGRGLAPSLTRLGRRVFVPTLDGELWCLNIDSGERLWSVPLTLGAWGSLAVGVDRVFAGGADGSLSALNAETGRVEWRTQLGAPITTAVRRGERALFVGTLDGRVHRVDLWNGTILASRQLDARLAPRSAPLVQPEALVVQVGNEDDSQQALISVDRSLTRERWRITANEHWTTARAFVWKNTLLVGTAFGDVQAFCSADGSLAWTHKLPGTVRTIAGVDDTLYIGTTGGQVQAMKPPATCAGN